MFKRKKWLVMLVLTTFVLLLAACGEKEKTNANEEESNYDNPRNHTTEDFMSISKGFEDYSIWIETSDTPERKSNVSGLYIFKDGEAEYYDGFSEVFIEDIIDLSDDEIIQYAKENSSTNYQGKYNLDITIDSLGQNTEKIEAIWTEGTEVWTFDLMSAAEESYYGTGELSDVYPDLNSYISALKSGKEELGTNYDTQTNEITGDEVIATRPIENGETMITLQSEIIHQTIFDTTFSGLKIGDHSSLLTRVNDSFVGFKLDSPDTDKKNVTIEKYK
ncbi:hypothetical protein [Virgibacillus halodenitrificans]|uniref:hypothetical protein n=1 Tax=Virgibacillus halodenitrificans TaxID=1482 RepID=UPI000EF539B8|nr:hypothetical protein [Virgibacillus halodenitrificans]